MFRKALFTAALLAGCGNKPAPEARIVRIPDEAVRYLPTASIGCNLERVEKIIFNQHNQRISFRGGKCNEEGRFTVVDGNRIFANYKDIRTDRIHSNEAFSIHKLGPSTEKEFLRGLIPQGESINDQCNIVEVQPHIWKILLKDQWTIESSTIEEGAESPCGRYSTQPDWQFVISEGIVFAINSRRVRIDYSTLTYTNLG